LGWVRLLSSEDPIEDRGHMVRLTDPGELGDQVGRAGRGGATGGIGPGRV